MVDQFWFEIVASFHCSTCHCIRQEKTSVCAPVAEPSGSQIFALASDQNRKCPVCNSRISPEDHCGIRPAGPIETWPSDLPFRWNRIQISPRQAARELLRELASGSSDTYETYRSLYHLWCTQDGAVQELRPLFSIPGIEPAGQLSVTEEFKGQVRSSAISILANLSD